MSVPLPHGRGSEESRVLGVVGSRSWAFEAFWVRRVEDLKKSQIEELCVRRSRFRRSPMEESRMKELPFEELRFEKSRIWDSHRLKSRSSKLMDLRVAMEEMRVRERCGCGESWV